MRDALALLVLAAGCSRTPEVDTRRSIELVVRPTAVALRAGETVQLTVQVNDARGVPIGAAPVTFTADSGSIVRVSSQGLVSAVGVAGRDSITVSSDSLRRRIPISIAAGWPTVIDVTSGAHQAGLVGGTLGEPVVVAVRDAFGNAVARQVVRFNAESGGQTAPTTATTDASGRARVLWTLGPLAGAQYLAVTADTAAAATASVDAIARAGSMATVVDLEPIGRRVVAGDTVRVRLRALDRYGNGVAGAVFAYTTVAQNGEVTPARSESDSTGLVSATWRTGRKAGVEALQVHAFQVIDTTFRLIVRTVGGPPAVISLVSGNGQRGRAGTTVGRAPVVRVTDQYGNPAAAVRVTFLAASGGSTVQPSDAATNEAGLASPKAWTLGGVGDHTLLIVADGVPDTIRVLAKSTAK